MVLETHMRLCVTDLVFLKKNILPPKLAKWAKDSVLWIYWKILLLIFSKFVLWWELMLLIVFLHKSQIWESTCFIDLRREMFSANHVTGFLNQLYLQNRSMKHFYFLHCGCSQKWVNQSGHGTLKVTVSQEWTDGTNLFFCILVQIRENENLIQWFLNFWFNGLDLLVHPGRFLVSSHFEIKSLVWGWKLS